MDMKTNKLIVVTAIVMSSLSVAFGQSELTPDEAPINYVDKVPEKGTPQAAMVEFIRLREGGKLEEAGEQISTTCPQWLRDSMLEPASAAHGLIKIDTLSYQLREYTPEKALVNVSFNCDDGTHSGWTRSLIREDEKWVLR